MINKKILKKKVKDILSDLENENEDIAWEYIHNEEFVENDEIFHLNKAIWRIEEPEETEGFDQKRVDADFDFILKTCRKNGKKFDATQIIPACDFIRINIIYKYLDKITKKISIADLKSMEKNRRKEERELIKELKESKLYKNVFEEALKCLKH